MFFHNPTKALAVAAAAIVIGGGAYGIASATASSGSAATTSSGQPLARGGGSNARSGPAAGGASGTVASVADSSFTLTTSAGQTVTVNTGSSASADAMSKSESVLVLGTVNGTTITAGHVIVRPTSSPGSATSSATAVVPFQRGAVSVQAGRPDPGGLQRGVGDDRQR